MQYCLKKYADGKDLENVADPTFAENNSKYYAEQSELSAQRAEAEANRTQIHDTTNDITYTYSIKLVNGNPAIYYEYNDSRLTVCRGFGCGWLPPRNTLGGCSDCSA